MPRKRLRGSPGDVCLQVLHTDVGEDDPAAAFGLKQVEVSSVSRRVSLHSLSEPRVSKFEGHRYVFYKCFAVGHYAHCFL